MSAITTKPKGHSAESFVTIPRGYKRTDVGVIPNDWDAPSLQDGITLLSGHHVLAHFCNTRGEGVPYLTGPADFPDGKLQHTKFTNRPTTLCKANDILVTVKGSGSGSLVKSDAVYCISRQLMAIRVWKWDAKFIYFSLAQNASRIRAASTGLIPGLSRRDILEQKLPLPNNPVEQRAIARALSDVDGLIGALDKLIAKKRAIKQATMQQLLTGMIRLPSFQTCWKSSTLGQLAPLQRGFDLPTRQLLEGPHPVVYSNGVLAHHAKSMVNGPGVVTGRSGTIGKVHFVERSFWPHNTTLWVTSFGMNDPRFIYYFYSFLDFSRFVSGSGVPTLNRNYVHQYEVSCPPPDEQRAIATVLSDMDSEIAALDGGLDKTTAIKHGMMQSLLTGRIRLVTGATEA